MKVLGGKGSLKTLLFSENVWTQINRLGTGNPGEEDGRQLQWTGSKALGPDDSLPQHEDIYQEQVSTVETGKKPKKP